MDSLSFDAETPAATNFAGWFPIRLFVRDESVWVDWCWRGPHSFRASSFQEDAQYLLQLPFNLAFRRYTPIATLVDWADYCAAHGSSQRYAPLKALVAHVSRCGSALIGQMLAREPTHVVISEPPMFDVLLGIRHRLPQVSREDQIVWLRALAFVLGHAPAQEQHLVITLDAWHVLERDLIREAFPHVPWLFLYRDPLEVALSQLRQRALYMVPGANDTISGLVPPPERASEEGAEAFVASVLGRIFDAGAALCEQQIATPVNFQSLPACVWRELRVTFGVDDDALAIEALQTSAQHIPAALSEVNSPHARDASSLLLQQKVAAMCSLSYGRIQAMDMSRP